MESKDRLGRGGRPTPKTSHIQHMVWKFEMSQKFGHIFLAKIALFHVSLVSRLAEKRAPKEVQKAKGSLEPGEENACFSEKSHLCFRGWQRIDGKPTPFYNDLNLQRRQQTCVEELELTASETLFRKCKKHVTQHASSYNILWGAQDVLWCFLNHQGDLASHGTFSRPRTV